MNGKNKGWVFRTAKRYGMTFHELDDGVWEFRKMGIVAWAGAITSPIATLKAFQLGHQVGALTATGREDEVEGLLKKWDGP